MNKTDNSLRIKVTGNCNKKCVFCHEEGGMDSLEEINFDSKLQAFIYRINEDLSIRKIALTGGEPLTHSDLTGLIKSIFINTNIKDFSITTNGTINRDYSFWNSLKIYGLNRANISISDINYNDFKNQLKTLHYLNEVQIKPVVNIVIYKDYHQTIKLLDCLTNLENLEFDIALLHNLSSKETYYKSDLIIKRIINDRSFVKYNSTISHGTSNNIAFYHNKNNQIIQIKSTKRNNKPYFFYYMCSNCLHRNNCQEGFYGIRLEKKNSEFMVRLCIHLTKPNTYFSIDDFINSEIYKQLKQLWNSQHI